MMMTQVHDYNFPRPNPLKINLARLASPGSKTPLLSIRMGVRMKPKSETANFLNSVWPVTIITASTFLRSVVSRFSSTLMPNTCVDEKYGS